MLSQLFSSRQQVDTLEKEVEARSRENLLLRQQLQELTDFAGGFTVTKPKDWSLEEQNTALRMLVRNVMKNMAGEGECMSKLEKKKGKDNGFRDLYSDIFLAQLGDFLRNFLHENATTYG